MNKFQYLLPIFLLSVFVAFGQDKGATGATGPTGKTSVIDKVTKFSNDIVDQGQKGADTTGDKFIQDNLTLTIPTVWKDKAFILMSDLKINKADEDPFVKTLPLPQKKLVKGMVLTLNTIHKSPQDKKQQVLTQIKTHLADYYKQAGKPASSKELDDQVNSFVTGPEKLTTNQGKDGELYLFHDIQAQQSNYIILFMIPGAKPGTVQFVQFQFYKYIYETTFPDDIMEWRTFVYPDDQKAYVDFAKKIIKSLVIR
jgi:hypothetical protein